MDRRTLCSSLDALGLDLDMLLFQLEQDPKDSYDAAIAERSQTRRQLERLQQQLQTILGELDGSPFP